MPEIPLTSLPPRLQKQFENARTALDRGNAEYAINICRDILTRHPGCLPVRHLLRAAQLKVHKARNRIVAKTLGAITTARSLLSAQSALKRDPAKAMQAAERALDSDPTNLAALRAVAQAAQAMELPETAVFALETMREQAPNDPTVLAELADGYIAAGRSREALSIAEALLNRRPGDAEVQELLKRASVAQSITQGRWDSGSGTFRDKLRDEHQAVSLEQSNKAVLSEEMALRLVNETIARISAEPTNLNHFRTVISGFRNLGRFDDALVWVGKARELPMGGVDPSLEKLESELRVARIEERLKARAEAVKAAGADPANDPQIVRLRDELTHQRISELRVLADKYPNESSYKFELGRLFEDVGQIELAIQQFQMAQRTPKLRIAALTHLGACFRAKGMNDLALQQFETAKAELPLLDDEKKDVIYQLAGCYAAMGLPEKALEEYKLIYSADIGFRDVAAKIDSFYSRS